ncbi:transporter substrate-binding domain-containing protein [Spartinivicinus poritis]|uniref:Transporter substrate-binding domain-containing protein n=1 Tax=Spartinivicinus poritis TaxID=2994640 RepID=A0ABT5UBP5_9GAMM|nr:transporter substrate-binding domain-containing protein [Spartinivicinus sp. A2-2]MDE1463806.1 transporter substrate-binding domain-containing protein [Spartinivicinus sp. A2-2]
MKYIALAIMLFTLNALAEPTVVKYLKKEEDSARYSYYYELIDIVLETTKSSFGDYKIEPLIGEMTAARWNQTAIEGKLLNLLWSPAGMEGLDTQMIPIPVPLVKGLTGYRVFLIHKANQPKFSQVKTLADLKLLTVGQGQNWGDVPIFQHNGIEVVEGSTYEGLFGMLAAKRFDYFSRGLNEIIPEYQARKDQYPSMAIEQEILLFYPYPFIFFASKNTPELAKRLEAGLMIMIKNGSLDNHFNKYHKSTLQALNLQKRKLLKISNPFLPSYIPVNDKKLWYSPFSTN